RLQGALPNVDAGHSPDTLARTRRNRGHGRGRPKNKRRATKGAPSVRIFASTGAMGGLLRARALRKALLDRVQLAANSHVAGPLARRCSATEMPATAKAVVGVRDKLELSGGVHIDRPRRHTPEAPLGFRRERDAWVESCT